MGECPLIFSVHITDHLPGCLFVHSGLGLGVPQFPSGELTNTTKTYHKYKQLFLKMWSVFSA